MPNSVLSLLALLFFAFQSQQSTPPAAAPTLNVIPPDAARMVNPITPTPKSQADAKSQYNISVDKDAGPSHLPVVSLEGANAARQLLKAVHW